MGVHLLVLLRRRRVVLLLVLLGRPLRRLLGHGGRGTPRPPGARARRGHRPARGSTHKLSVTDRGPHMCGPDDDMQPHALWASTWHRSCGCHATAWLASTAHILFNC